MGQVADDALRDLEKDTDMIESNDYSEAELIELPQMQTIRNKAQKALFLVQISTGEGSTIKFLELGQS